MALRVYPLQETHSFGSYSEYRARIRSHEESLRSFWRHIPIKRNRPPRPASRTGTRAFWEWWWCISIRAYVVRIHPRRRIRCVVTRASSEVVRSRPQAAPVCSRWACVDRMGVRFPVTVCRDDFKVVRIASIGRTGVVHHCMNYSGAARNAQLSQWRGCGYCSNRCRVGLLTYVVCYVLNVLKSTADIRIVLKDRRESRN